MTKRIVFYLLIALASFLVLKSANAQTSNEYWGAGTGRFHGTAEAACQDLFEAKVASGYYDSTYSVSFVGALTSNGTRACYAKRPGYQQNTYGDARRFTCTLPKVFDPVLRNCVEPPPPPVCSAGNKGSGRWGAGGSIRSVAETGGCVGGCRVNITGVQSCWGPTSGDCSTGQCSCIYDYEGTGSECTPGLDAPGTIPNPGEMPRVDVPPTKPPAGKPCPAGTVQGGVDSAGTPICIGTGTDPKNSKPPPPKTESEKTEQKSDGSTVTTKTEVTQNSDGSTTTKTTTVTKGPDGSTKTDVTMDTSNTPTGGKGKDESAKDDEKYDLCKQNPNLTICRNSSVSGACGEISCQGDAIQCATLRAAAAMECRTKKQEEDFLKRPEIVAGQQILDGNDPMKGAIDAALKGETVDFGANSLDQSGFLGGGSCLAPRTFTLLGRSVTVSFDVMCSNIQPLRYVILACAFIFAYLIVSRAALEA